jgi:hypothetical protein
MPTLFVGNCGYAFRYDTCWWLTSIVCECVPTVFNTILHYFDDSNNNVGTESLLFFCCCSVVGAVRSVAGTSYGGKQNMHPTRN